MKKQQNERRFLITKMQNNTSKKAAIYIRVSTDAQREEGYSIDAQKEMLTAYCISKGIKAYEYYIDGGFSGSNLDRPQLKKLISDIKAKKISCVLVYKLDRLSRSQKDTLYLIEDVFNPNGVDFISLNESMDTSTPLGRLMLGILSAFAQLERENIRERTRMGMKERIKSGLWPGGGRIPFGYDYNSEKGILVPNSDAETVRRIYDLYIEGYSPRRIAEITGLKYERLAIQILKRKSNAGYIEYNGEEYLGKHEPIISLDKYNEAMELMRERSSLRNTESLHLLTGLLVCGECGAKMRYQKWGKNGYKIVCYSRDKSKKHLVKDESCKNELFWDYEIEDIILKDLFSAHLKKSTGIKQESTEKSVLKMLKEKKDSLEKKLKKLYNLYAEDDSDVLLETIEDLKKELLLAEKQIETEVTSNTIKKKIIAAKKKLDTLEDTWELMTLREQKNVIRSLIEKIVISPQNISIHYRFDFDK